MKSHPMLATDNASAWLGIEVLHSEYGNVTLSVRVRHDMLNGFGIMHGGMIFAFADTCFAMACNDPAEAGRTMSVGQGADINFIASARLGQTLKAQGRIVEQVGRTGYYDVEVRADDNAVIALFRGRSRTIPHREERSLE